MFVRYIGVVVMLIGAIMLLLKSFANLKPQNNDFLFISVALVVIGYLLFIFLDKRAENKVVHEYEDESVRIKPIQKKAQEEAIAE